MIARVWSGKTKNEHAAIYQQIIEERDMLGYSKTQGFVKHSFLKHSDDTFTYFKLLTYWEDIAAVKNFAGSNYNKAVGFKEDEPLVIDWPGSVQHYEVFAP